MKCTTHQIEAVAICAYCGRAACADCIKPSPTNRVVCSENCSAALERGDKAMEMILQKSFQTARASAFYSFLCGGLSAAGAIGAHFYLPSPFLIWFCGGCSVVCIASGIWYGRIAKQQK
jgi:predicted nucleic acid-binding Zn ribbon protein